MYAALAVICTFIGCCSNVVFLEVLVREFPGSGNIITFVQFLFIALEGFVFTTDFGRKGPVIPLKHYATLVGLFFVVQVINNYAFTFNISMPLHMIFRAGSLIANMILGIIILKRRYTLTKYLSVILITLGIILCTAVSANEVKASHTSDKWGGAYDLLVWILGVSLLTLALTLSARMGIFQEELYGKYGKHPKESLFYNHALPLPLFIFLAKDIYNHMVLFNQTTPYELPVLGVSLPWIWWVLILNTLTQYICIRSVFVLTTECQSLTVTLVVTLRKFISLIFSIYYFQNPFTFYHWVGTALVFTGTLMFVNIVNIVKQLTGYGNVQKSKVQ